MLRIIEIFNNLPQCITVDQGVNFQPGQVGALMIKDGDIVVTVCDGLNPIGVLDDIKTNKFRKIVWNKVIIVPISSFSNDGTTLGIDYKWELQNQYIIEKSFISSISVSLDAKKGIITIPMGTAPNYCLHPSAHSERDFMDAIKIVVSYAYNIHAQKIEDSTIGSKKATLWYKNMIAETDMFDTTQLYNKYTPLYVSDGLLTTKRQACKCKCIGVVLDPPSHEHAVLKFLLDIDNKIEIGANNKSFDLKNHPTYEISHD